jgi:hypothetical protein
LQSDSSQRKFAGMVSNIKYEVDVRDVEYQRQATCIYQPKGTNRQDRLSIQERRSRSGDGF